MMMMMIMMMTMKEIRSWQRRNRSLTFDRGRPFELSSSRRSMAGERDRGV